MALIKCSECGADVSEKALECPKCGCPLDITKQMMSDAKKRKNKQLYALITVIIAIIIVSVAGVFFVKHDNTPGDMAIRIIKKDFGSNISVESIYYNAEKNGCIVKFSANGEDNTATVHLDDKIAGYKSVMDEYTNKSKTSATEKEKTQYAQQLLDYMSVYDMLWEYDLLMNGTSEDGWEKIK